MRAVNLWIGNRRALLAGGFDRDVSFFRLVGYFLVGTIAGTLGALLGVDKVFPGLNWLPWLLIIFLFGIALGADQKIAAVPGLGRAVHLIRSRTLRFPPLARAAVVGISTPLLPCGPLYAVIAIAFAAGGGIEGGRVMLTFGLGAIPAIWATQVASAWVDGRLNARQIQNGRKILAGAAAVSLAFHFVLPVAVKAGNGEAINLKEPACDCELNLKVE